jgi:hypothetical protein
MLGLKGAFVVVGATQVAPILLDARAYAMHCDRLALAEPEKAYAVTFGAGTIYAFPCVERAMVELAQGYTGIHAPMVRKLCALIALGAPIPNDWRGSSPRGGERVEQTPQPPTRPPSGAQVRLNRESADAAISF